jgi:hypothetical protein
VAIYKQACCGCTYGDGTVVDGVTMRHSYDDVCNRRRGDCGCIWADRSKRTKIWSCLMGDMTAAPAATAANPSVPVPPVTPGAPVGDGETPPCQRCVSFGGCCSPEACCAGCCDGTDARCEGCGGDPVSAQQDEMDVPYGRPPVCPTCAPRWARVADDCGHHLVGLDCQLHGPVNHGSPCDGNHIPDADGNPVCTPVGPSPEETCSFPACAHEGCICPTTTRKERRGFFRTLRAALGRLAP